MSEYLMLVNFWYKYTTALAIVLLVATGLYLLFAGGLAIYHVIRDIGLWKEAAVLLVAIVVLFGLPIIIAHFL